MKVGDVVCVSKECSVLRFRGVHGIVIALQPGPMFGSAVAKVLLPTELHLISCDKLEVINEDR